LPIAVARPADGQNRDRYDAIDHYYGDHLSERSCPGMVAVCMGNHGTDNVEKPVLVGSAINHKLRERLGRVEGTYW
jgi:hypothetical protein